MVQLNMDVKKTQILRAESGFLFSFMATSFPILSSKMHNYFAWEYKLNQYQWGGDKLKQLCSSFLGQAMACLHINLIFFLFKFT